MDSHLDRVLQQLTIAHAEGAFGSDVSLGDHVRDCDTCKATLTLALTADGHYNTSCVVCGRLGHQHLASAQGYLPDQTMNTPERAADALQSVLSGDLNPIA